MSHHHTAHHRAGLSESVLGTIQLTGTEKRDIQIVAVWHVLNLAKDYGQNIDKQAAKLSALLCGKVDKELI